MWGEVGEKIIDLFLRVLDNKMRGKAKKETLLLGS
jgi:hypothetical protein